MPRRTTGTLNREVHPRLPLLAVVRRRYPACEPEMSPSGSSPASGPSSGAAVCSERCRRWRQSPSKRPCSRRPGVHVYALICLPKTPKSRKKKMLLSYLYCKLPLTICMHKPTSLFRPQVVCCVCRHSQLSHPCSHSPPRTYPCVFISYANVVEGARTGDDSMPVWS